MGILRILLALSVIAEHSTGFLGNKLVGGPTAVQSFYLMSGFYMALVLNGKYNFPGSYRPFIVQRLLRLYPVYVLVVLATLAWAWAGYHSTGIPYTNAASWFSSDIGLPAKILLVISHVTLIGQDAVSFFVLSGTPLSFHYAPHSLFAVSAAWNYLLVPQAWSISVELIFYAIAPFLVRMGVRRQILFVAVTMTFRALMYCDLGYNYDPWIHRFLPIELGIFILGSLAYQFYVRFEEQLKCRREFAYISLGLIFHVSLFYYDAELAYKRPLFYALILVSLPSLFAVFQKNRFDHWIAELSYPVYMVHILVIYVVHSFVDLPAGYNSLAYAAVSIVVAAGIVKVLILPLDRWRRRLLTKEELTLT